MNEPLTWRPTGQQLIGQADVAGVAPLFQAFNPSQGEWLPTVFSSARPSDIDQACTLAAQAFDRFRATGPQQRAAFLERVASALEALGPALVDCAMAETGLPQARLEGERGRTCGQLRLFAQTVRAGHWQQLTLDSALPDRQPLPRPDLRQRQVPVGPVAVFGASNFPLAFSVAGGDTASALAAGCPVVVKAHPSHPGTSEMVGRAVRHAVQQAGLPEGVFSMLTGVGHEVGQQLVAHPAIQAVGFTGSRSGGLALLRVAQSRPQPIPVFAEMSAINPVLMLPAALALRAESLAQGLVASLTLGTGQFCTNPGLVLGVAGAGWDRLVAGVRQALPAQAAGTMLNPGILAAYQRGVAHWASVPGVHTVAEGQAAPAGGRCAAQDRVVETSAQQWLANPALEDEVFGPASMLVRCDSAEELRAVVAGLSGQLTATLHLEAADADDLALARTLLPVLERKAGRILVNGFPTGVEVAHAMVHGGPYPATTDSRSTSVGTQAMTRFLRPVCYQDLPQALLPEALRDASLPSAWRRVDGQWVAPESSGLA